MGLLVSKCLFSIISVIAFFICWNDFVCSSFHSSLLFFIFSLCERSGLSGADIFDKFGMNFVSGVCSPLMI